MTATTITSNDAHQSHAVDWTDTANDYYKTLLLRRGRIFNGVTGGGLGRRVGAEYYRTSTDNET